jgi:anti-sigma regulatory factor (Ser/Thr protein kinase)
VTPAEIRAAQRVTGSADPGLVEALHDAVERLWAAVPDVPPTDRMRFETAVVELATNIVRHTRPVGVLPVRAVAELRAVDHALEAVFEDDGLAVEVDLAPPEPDELAVTGRGLLLIQRAVDSLTFAREGDRNVWRIAHRYALA